MDANSKIALFVAGLGAIGAAFAFGGNVVSFFDKVHQSPTTPVVQSGAAPVEHVVVHQAGTQPSQMLDGADNLIITQAMVDQASGSQKADFDSYGNDPVTNAPMIADPTCDDGPFRIMNASNQTEALEITEWETDNVVKVAIGPGERWLGAFPPAKYQIGDEANHWGRDFEIDHCTDATAASN